MKTSITIDPKKLGRAKELLGTSSVSETIDRALTHLLAAEVEQQWADGYARVPDSTEQPNPVTQAQGLDPW